MKRLVIIFTLAVLCAGPTAAQKLVIGSRVAAFKPDRELTWLTPPAPDKKGWLIDFYSSKNPSCVKFYENLPAIAKSLNGKVPIVIISRTGDDQFKELAERDGSKYYFAVDADGKSHAAFGIQYVPYSVLLNDDNEILWQGNLSKFTEQASTKIK